MQFSPDLRDQVLAGRITVSFRLWQRPKVKIGGRYRLGTAVIVVDDIDLIPFSAVTDADVRHAGESSRDALRERAAHAGPIHADTLLYRVEFHVER